MSNKEINELKRLFTTRLEVLDQLLTKAEEHFGDLEPLLAERLAPDMYPLGTQIAFSCNQPRAFAYWAADREIENLPAEVPTKAMALAHLSETKALIAAIDIDDKKLEEIKRIVLSPEIYCELPGKQYVNDFIMPNFYFHITTAYAILRKLGAPLGKADFMAYLLPFVRHTESGD
ncbi:DUF1993 domain-containing protein [Halioxenophilus sp. WMMB6]|uniref:DUF1993 domain-containing protein n=1 Tax=Halioxenophilus sp. WMMB6 TaxID=3073815 RepID=UPI00295ED1F2|nr:DUF1993 domain-containing protein [Halioxenophilus sp. WMMB6]